MITGFLFIGLYIIISGGLLTKDASTSFYNYNLDDKKEHVKNEVLNRLDEIEYERGHLINDNQIVLRDKIQLVRNLLLESDITSHPDSELHIPLAIEKYEEIVANDSEYLYFAINPRGGIMMRSGTDNNIVGVNLYDSRDIDGVYYIQEIIKATETTDGIFVDYYWPKSKDTEPIKKTSYCLYVPEFDLIIGTGVYHDDLQYELQNRIYSRLQEYYSHKENYIFVSEFDSTARVSGNPDLIGEKMSEIKAFDGASIHQLFMDKVNDTGKGYVTYSFYKKNETVLSEKKYLMSTNLKVGMLILEWAYMWIALMKK